MWNFRNDSLPSPLYAVHLAAPEQPLFMGNRWKTYRGEENGAGRVAGGGRGTDEVRRDDLHAAS